MLAKRIIPCLDVADGKVVKGVRFRQHQVVGEIVELAKFYSDSGADELVFYDITASADRRKASRLWVERIAKFIHIPFCVGGGIDSIEVAESLLFSGADKISVNTPALLRPTLVTELAARFGRQCVVVGIDSLKIENEFRVRSHTGRSSSERDGGWRTMDWIEEVVKRGAGEVVLNCMDRDGVRGGYDIEQLRKACQLCKVPLIASGGAGKVEHFAEVFSDTMVSGALGAGIFHEKKVSILDIKKYCAKQGILVREEWKENSH